MRSAHEVVARTDSENTYRSEDSGSSGTSCSHRVPSLEAGMTSTTLEIQRMESAESVGEDNASALLDEEFLCPSLPAVNEVGVTDSTNCDCGERSSSKDSTSEKSASDEMDTTVVATVHRSVRVDSVPAQVGGAATPPAVGEDDRGPSWPAQEDSNSCVANGRTIARQ